MTGTTTLPLSPGAALVLLMGAVAFVALALRDRLGQRDTRAIPPEARPALWLMAGAIWVALFLAALAVAFSGAAAAMREPGSAGLGLGGLLVALLGAPFLIWTTVLKDQTVRFQKAGHMTDRISKAVEQLGVEKEVTRLMRNATFRDGDQTLTMFEGRDEEKIPEGAQEITRGDWQIVKRSVPNLEVRIGAILSLERIAQDSTYHDRGRDHVRVMEILCAYIRHNAPAKDAQDHPYGDWEQVKNGLAPEARAALRDRRTGHHGGQGQIVAWAQALTPPRADIAEALKVIGRRSRKQLLVEAAWPQPYDSSTKWPFDKAPHLGEMPSFPGHDWTAANGFEPKFTDWRKKVNNFTGYRLDLRYTNLQRAELENFRLQGARLKGARLEGAKLWKARLENAYLEDARFEGARAWEAHLQGASLARARMEGANLGPARLEGAYLGEARLEGAFLGGKEGGARLAMANLTGAKLDGTNLWQARMEGANLKGADLSHAELGVDQIASAFGDASVTLPSGVAPGHPDWPRHWAPRVLDAEEYQTQYNLWREDPAVYSQPPP